MALVDWFYIFSKKKKKRFCNLVVELFSLKILCLKDNNIEVSLKWCRSVKLCSSFSFYSICFLLFLNLGPTGPLRESVGFRVVQSMKEDCLLSLDAYNKFDKIGSFGIWYWCNLYSWEYLNVEYKLRAV